MEMNHGLYAAFVEVMHVETNLCDPSVVRARMPCQLTHRVVSLYWSNSPLPIFLLYSAAQPAVCHQDFHSVQCWTPRHCLSLVPGKCCVAVRWLWWGLVSFNKLYNCLGHHQPVGEEKQVCCGWRVGDALSPLPCPHNISVIFSFIFTSYLTCFLI